MTGVKNQRRLYASVLLVGGLVCCVGAAVIWTVADITDGHSAKSVVMTMLFLAGAVVLFAVAVEKCKEVVSDGAN